jgi:hypothetical protein
MDRYFKNRCMGSSLLFYLGDQLYLAVHKVDTQFTVHSKAMDVDQATGVDLQNAVSPSPLDTRRINRYPHLPPLDTCYDILCDPYTYQVRTSSAAVWVHVCRRCNLSRVELILFMTLNVSYLLIPVPAGERQYFMTADMTVQSCMVKFSSKGTGIDINTRSLVLKNKQFNE